MIRVFVNGASGKMGREASAAVLADPALELVGTGGRGDDLAARLRETGADVAVDFTTADAAAGNARTIIAVGVRPVIGTSGVSGETFSELAEAARAAGIGGVVAPNFAIGAVLMMRFAALAAAHLPDVEIVELHHDAKPDAPSGTAMRTAELVDAARAASGAAAPREERTSAAGLPFRGARHAGVPVHSVRLPGLVAHQKVMFGGTSEVLTISHDSYHRASFMPGVCLACRKAPTLERLVFGLDALLFGPPDEAGVAG